MKIRIIEKAIDRTELIKIGEEGFGDLIKAVVDVARKIMAVGGELHADGEALLVLRRKGIRALLFNHV